jgi:phosphate:Na+ symporter
MVEPLEDVIDDLTQQLKTNHIQRLQAGQCTLELGFIYNDCINNFERVADHCSNIAVAALESADASLLPHDYLNDLSHGDHADYRQQVADYRRKYLDALTGQA